METIHMENEMEINTKVEEVVESSTTEETDNTESDILTSELNHESQTGSDDNKNEDDESSNKLTEILAFRDQLLAREILSSGVNITDKIVHFGSGYKNELIWDYLSAIKQQNLVQEMNVIYTAVDIDADSISDISKKNAENNTGIDLRLVNNTMQSFIDSNTDEFDWAIITGIFDKNLYEEKQLEFIDKIIASILNFSREGLIFTFDSSKEMDESYNIKTIMNYVSSLYTRYRINRINENDYIICIYKYYHSIIPQ